MATTRTNRKGNHKTPARPSARRGATERERLEARVRELEAALAAADRARCPVCGERLTRPADEIESI
jgi:hypothetical protein